MANIDGNSVSVLMATTPGSFAAATFVKACAYPSTVIAGDFDLDGRQDLAVSCELSSSVALLVGFGDGMFFPGQKEISKRGSGPLAIGDVNGNYGSDYIGWLTPTCRSWDQNERKPSAEKQSFLRKA